MIIKTTKSTFQRVPEGEQELTITEVKLVPSGKPQQVIFSYLHSNGATMKEYLDLNKPKAVEILGKRCDVLYDGNMPEGTEIDASDLPNMFTGKIAKAVVVHNVKDDKTYVNIRYVISYSDGETDAEDDI